MILDDLRKKMSDGGTPRGLQRKLSNPADRDDEDESHLTRQESKSNPFDKTIVYSDNFCSFDGK